jgi:hypothetical protein
MHTTDLQLRTETPAHVALNIFPNVGNTVAKTPNIIRVVPFNFMNGNTQEPSTRYNCTVTAPYPFPKDPGHRQLQI